MDAARFVAEEGAGHSGGEIVEGEAWGLRRVFVPEGGVHAFQKAFFAEGNEGGMEAGFELLLLVGGEGADPGGEGFGFEDAERDELAAAGSAAGAAGDLVAFGVNDLDGGIDDVAGEGLEGGKELDEGDVAAGNGERGLEAAGADGEGEVDLDVGEGADVVRHGAMSIEAREKMRA